MSDTPPSLVLDLVEWVAARPRAYGEVMDAWRTSCPRLTVWEDAEDQGLVERVHSNGAEVVAVTAAGRNKLALAGRAVPVATEPGMS
jgi:hypothetical protein